MVCAFTGILYNQKNVEWNTSTANDVDNYQLDSTDNDLFDPMMNKAHDDFDYDTYKENVPLSDLEPDENLEFGHKKRLRYSEHFANLYGSLKSFVSGSIPENNVIEQTKDVDLDSLEDDDFNEPISGNSDRKLIPDKDLITDEDLIPNEDYDHDQGRLRPSEHFANLFGSLHGFASSFIPEWNMSKQKENDDHFDIDDIDFDDLDEPNNVQDDIEDQDTFGYEKKESLEDSRKFQDKNHLKDPEKYPLENNNNDSENFHENLKDTKHDNLDNSEEEKHISLDEKEPEKSGDWGPYIYDCLHAWFNSEQPKDTKSSNQEKEIENSNDANELDNSEQAERASNLELDDNVFGDKENMPHEHLELDDNVNDDKENKPHEEQERYPDKTRLEDADHEDFPYQDKEDYGSNDRADFERYYKENYDDYNEYDNYYDNYYNDYLDGYYQEDFDNYDPERYGSYEPDSYGNYDPYYYGSYDDQEDYYSYDDQENYYNDDPENYYNDDSENYYYDDQNHHDNYYKDDFGNFEHEHPDNSYENSEDESNHDKKEESSQNTISREDEDKDQKEVDFLGLFPDNFEQILKDSQKTSKNEQDLEHTEDISDQDDFFEETNEKETDAPQEITDERENSEDDLNDDQLDNTEDSEAEKTFSLDDKARGVYNMFAWRTDHLCMSRLSWLFNEVDQFLDDKMTYVYRDVGVAIDVMGSVMTYYLEGLARILAPIDFGMVKLSVIILIHAIYIWMASKWVSRPRPRPVAGNPEVTQEVGKENSKVEEEDEDIFFDGLENCIGDSKVPGIFQDPEAVVTTSVDPKTFPEIESAIEKKDEELTGEQEKKVIQRPRRFGRNRSLFSGVPTLCKVVNPLKMKLPGMDTDNEEHISMRRRMKEMKASTSKTNKN